MKDKNSIENWDEFKEYVNYEKNDLKRTIDDSIDSFKGPFKQEIENIMDDLQDGTFEIGGCLKKIVKWTVIIILFLAVIRSCADSNDNNSTNNNSEENIYNQTSENQNDNSVFEEDFTCIFWQKLFAYNNGIKLNDFSKEKNMVANFTENMDDNLFYVKDESVFGTSQYKLTTEQSDYMYNGKIKDNRPDGLGMLIKVSEFDYGIFDIDNRYYNIAYIGQFDEGKFNGYGLEFYQPDGNDYNSFSNAYSDKIDSDDYLSYYIGWTNYAEYEGIFKDGNREGFGNCYYADLELRRNLSTIIGETPTDTVLYDQIDVGTFKNGELHGKCQTYVLGKLSYDGDMKNGSKEGFGYSYDDYGNLEYKGEFKDDMRDGTGTLYDSNGNVIYDGEWKSDDYK